MQPVSIVVAIVFLGLLTTLIDRHFPSKPTYPCRSIGETISDTMGYVLVIAAIALIGLLVALVDR